MRHNETCSGPAAHEVVGMHLGSTCVGVVEVAPRQHFDASYTAGTHVGHETSEFVGR
jgi:hypothetical protein